MNNSVVMDIDGVLADFELAFCQTFGNMHRELVALESRYPAQARKITQFINDGYVYKDLEPIQLGLNICSWLNDNDFEVAIVTARPFGFESLTRDWLKRHSVNYTSFVRASPKEGQIALMKPLCAVDDLFSVHKALLGHNIPTIIVAHPWNRYISENMLRILDLSEFVSAFGGIMYNYSQVQEQI
jgi:hypothetical protein